MTGSMYLKSKNNAFQFKEYPSGPAGVEIQINEVGRWN